MNGNPFRMRLDGHSARPWTLHQLRLVTVAAFATVLGWQTTALHAKVIPIAERINAKEMPQNLASNATGFRGPSGDGRRGSAGFLYATGQGMGTRLSFLFERDASGYGFQAIHPLGSGHILVSVHSRGVTIHRGGSWADIGWGNPSNSERVRLTANSQRLLPLKANRPYGIVSELTAEGAYRLTINDTVICEQTVDPGLPLVLEVPTDKSVWGGSGWDRTNFTGKNFQPRLRTGHVGLILGPMDGSGPRQNFQSVALTAIPPARDRVVTAPQAKSLETVSYDRLLDAIEKAHVAEKLVRSKAVGGGGGGPFESAVAEPSILIGFDYTTSRFYGGHLTIKSVRPIYVTRAGETMGKWHGAPHGRVHRVKAKPGYAVSAVIAKQGHRIDGMRLLFLRVRGAGLNPDDAYRSEWIGGLGGGGETLHATYGLPIVSIFGRQGADIDAMGFIQLER